MLPAQRLFWSVPGLGINLLLDSSTINGYFEFTTMGFDTSFIAEKGILELNDSM